MTGEPQVLRRATW